MSSPAVASWTWAQRERRREREREREEGFHSGGMEKWTLKNKSDELGSREETWGESIPLDLEYLEYRSQSYLGGEMNRGQRWCITVQNKSFLGGQFKHEKVSHATKNTKHGCEPFFFFFFSSPFPRWLTAIHKRAECIFSVFGAEKYLMNSETWFIMASSTFSPEVQVKILSELWLHLITQWNSLYIEITFQDERSGCAQGWKCLDLTRKQISVHLLSSVNHSIVIVTLQVISVHFGSPNL